MDSHNIDESNTGRKDKRNYSTVIEAVRSDCPDRGGYGDAARTNDHSVVITVRVAIMHAATHIERVSTNCSYRPDNNVTIS